ncbi:MAG TPA: nucleoside-diphosphate sugar epimerase/dehydratase [Woeseiaceae bacterium]|nr:nucleoside-diphosphate sugar epimerase/dehydratase [Woeseiaceae bacterium]
MAEERPSLAQQFRTVVLDLPRAHKQAAMILSDVAGIVLCVWGAGWLATGARTLATVEMFLLTIVTVVVTVPIAWHEGLYRSIIRYMGADLFVAGSKTALSVSAVVGFLVYAGDLVAAPFRWAITFSALSLIYIVGSRFAARVFLNRRNLQREPVIIYGAGEGGARLAASLRGSDDFLPVAMVDDNILLHGKRVQGVEVYSPTHIERLIQDTGATRVLLAMPSASRRTRRQVLERLSDFPVHVQTIPEISDLVTGRARVDDIRDVEVEDLLGRDAVPPDPKLLRASVSGKRVMVTGAGGSIGAELCRQILHLQPKTLVLYEISEFALYKIDKELRGIVESLDSDCEIIPLIGSVDEFDRAREVLEAFQVNTVYHAAAYKHIPLVEHNLLEGISNNVFGTLHLARAAIEAGVDTFVLISTDKAVGPTSVMGATKRFAELILQALQNEHPSICFSMVRFGNVLASSGSVVPLFREQIRRGGPVTVTHREIIRYFMTIPEAAQLVIQAGAMAKGGDVFVLDMGEPVKIRDLARRMINLMGLTVRDENNPDGDIAIKYTGLRPAEKLFEELLIGTDVSGTSHPRIMQANEHHIPYDELLPLLEELQVATANRDRQHAREVLKKAVAGYEPLNGIDDLVWKKQHGDAAAAKEADKVIDITHRRGA